MNDEDKITAIYNPNTGMVGCVLLQAGFGGSTYVANLFNSKEWELAPTPGQTLIPATASQWQRISDMSREERVVRWNQKAAPKEPTNETPQ